MAGENLGTAVLTLDVDLTSIQSGLNKAKTLVENKKFDLTFSTSKAQESFRVLQNSASTLERQLSNIRSTPLKLDTKGLAKLPEDAAKAGVELSKLTRDILNGDKAVANSIAGIQQQARAFQTLAANVKIGSAEFVNFTQAAAKVSQRQLFGGFQEIEALQKLFKLGGFGGFDTFKGTDDLLKFASQVGDTPASINLYIEALQQARQVTGIADDNFAKLTQEIERQAKRFEEATNAANSYNSAVERQNRQARAIAEFGASPISGRRPDGTAIGGSPAFKADGQLALQELQRANAQIEARIRKGQEDRTRRFTDATGSAIIGGAFPALFGQGLGASLGGAAGGGLGGAVGGQFGFGLSLVGTALGAQFDAASQKAQLLATALKDPIEKFNEIKQAGLLSSKGLETQVETLIRLGRESEAAALVQKDLANSYAGAERAKQLADANDSLSRSYTKLSLAIADLALEPIAQLALEASASLKGFADTIRFFKGIIPNVPSFLPKGSSPGSAFFGPATPGFGVAAVLETGKALGRLFGGKQGDAGPSTGASAVPVFTSKELQLQRQINSLIFQGNAAKAQGNKAAELSIERQLVEQKRQQELDALAQKKLLPQERTRQQSEINQRAAQEQNRIAETMKARLDASGRELRNTTALIGLYGFARDIEQERQNIAEAKRQSELAAAAAARDPSIADAAKAALNEYLTIKMEGEKKIRDFVINGVKEAAATLSEAVNKLTDARLTLAGLQGAKDQGLNKYLNPQQQQLRLNTATASLGPDLERAISVATSLLKTQGISLDKTFIADLRSIVAGAGGKTATVGTINGQPLVSAAGPQATTAGLDRVQQFIRDALGENSAMIAVQTATQNLSEINGQLVTVNGDLLRQVQALAQKQWQVNVNVPGGTASGDVLGPVNAGF